LHRNVVDRVYMIARNVLTVPIADGTVHVSAQRAVHTALGVHERTAGGNRW